MIVAELRPEDPCVLTFVGLEVRKVEVARGDAWYAYGTVDDRYSRLFLGIERPLHGDSAFARVTMPSAVMQMFCRSAVLRYYEATYGQEYVGGEKALQESVKSFVGKEWPGLWTVVVDRKTTKTGRLLTTYEVTRYSPCQ